MKIVFYFDSYDVHGLLLFTIKNKQFYLELTLYFDFNVI
jgi:hypothetical protein